jgi:hypothetical protein
MLSLKYYSWVEKEERITGKRTEKFVRKLEGKSPFRNLGVDGIILKKQDMRLWT